MSGLQCVHNDFSSPAAQLQAPLLYPTAQGNKVTIFLRFHYSWPRSPLSHLFSDKVVRGLLQAPLTYSAAVVETKASYGFCRFRFVGRGLQDRERVKTAPPPNRYAEMPAQLTEELEATGLYRVKWVAVGSVNWETSRCAGVDAPVVDSMGPRSEGLYICPGMCPFFPSSNLLSVINNAPDGRRWSPWRLPLPTSHNVHRARVTQDFPGRLAIQAYCVSLQSDEQSGTSRSTSEEERAVC